MLELIEGFSNFFLHLGVYNSEVLYDAFKVLVARVDLLEVGVNIS